MGRTKIYSSNKDRISIHKFLREYIGIEHDIGKKLTHQKMHNIIDEENFKQRKKDITQRTYYNHPTCVNYSIIQVDDIKSGRYIEVIDDKKKIIIYRNPQLFSAKNLFMELEKMDKTTLEMLRYESLLKSGRIAYDEGGGTIF